MRKGVTRAEAETKLRQHISAIEKGCYVHATEGAAFHEVAAAWLAHKKTQVRSTSWDVLDQHVRIHLKPIRDVKINKLTLPIVEDLIDQLAGESVDEEPVGKCPDEKPTRKRMATATVRKILITLNQIMRYAIRHGLASFNPVTDAEKPKLERGPVDEDQVLKAEAEGLLIEATKDPKYKTLFMLAATTGAREGELLGLKWADVDFAEGRITIRRTFTKGKFFEPKTQASRRKVDLGPAMRMAMIAWRMACPSTKLDLVFPNGAGKPMNYSNMVRRHFQPALEAAGLPRVKFHSLRHSYASIQLAAGQPIKYVQNQLGHAAASVTLDTYGHYMDGVNHEAAAGLEERIMGMGLKGPGSGIPEGIPEASGGQTVNGCEPDVNVHSGQGVIH
jgi:integrase